MLITFLGYFPLRGRKTFRKDCARLFLYVGGMAEYFWLGWLVSFNILLNTNKLKD